MDLRQLRYFAAVARTGHLTRAAETLGMQQPPLTQQIRRLEAEAGLALFERHPKGMRLTEAGCALLADAGRLLADFDALRLRLHERSAGERGTLALAFTSSAAARPAMSSGVKRMERSPRCLWGGADAARASSYGQIRISSNLHIEEIWI